MKYLEQYDRDPATAAFLSYMERARYRVWRSQVETFKTLVGARSVLCHVGEDAWAQHYAANDDSVSSVVEELEKVAD